MEIVYILIFVFCILPIFREVRKDITDSVKEATGALRDVTKLVHQEINQSLKEPEIQR